MSWYKLLLLGVAVSACSSGGAEDAASGDEVATDLSSVNNTVIAPAAAPVRTNTNQCIVDLGGIQKCQATNFLGLPKDLKGCCDGVRQLAVDGCECNPALDLLLGAEGQKIYELEPLCRIVQPAKWLKVKPRIIRSCKPLQTHKYGCTADDMQIDAARLTSILTFQSFFRGATNEAMCLDTPAFSQQLAAVFAADVDVNVPYGIGTYRGIQDVSEYLGIAFAGLNHGYWENDTTPDPTKRARLEVSSNGSAWTTGGTTRGSFARGLLPYTDLYLEQEVSFEGCGSLVSDYTVLPNDGMRFLIESYVQTADLSKRWGVEDICRYHTQFCADDPETRQYASEEECLQYIGDLPLYTEACGPNRPLNGHSVSCKLKHHFMIPANPKLHCPHIGPLGAHDPNHHFKCDDTAECSEDQGQDGWPTIAAIGANTPANVVSAYEESNEGYETEPFGCAIPSGEHEHQP